MTTPHDGDAYNPDAPPPAPDGGHPPHHPSAPGFPHDAYGTPTGGYAQGTAPGGYDNAAAAGGHAQGGYGNGGYDNSGYGNSGYGSGGYDGGFGDGGFGTPGHPGQPGQAAPGSGHGAAGHPESGYPEPGYTGAGHLDAGHPAAQYADLGHYAGPAGDGTYVPEPLGGQLPDEADPGAAFGLPSAGDAWGGHATARDAYAGPADAVGWGQAPPAAQPWEQSAADPRAGYAAAQPQPEPQWTQPHAYAAQQPFAGAEHTAVLPPLGEEPPQAAPSPSAAPVRTGSPIIPPGIQPAAITAVLGLLMAGGAALGKPGLAVVLLVLEGVTAAGWFRLNGMWPARQGIMLAFLAGVTADVALLAADGGHNAEVLLGTLGVWLLLVLVLQLRHHGSADERLSSLTATSASTLLTVVAAGYLATAASGAGSDPVVVGAIAVAAATLVRAVRLPGGEPVSLMLSVLAALATGLATGPATGMGAGHGVLLAAAAGACALVGLRVASYDFPSRFVHFTAGVALPLTAAAPVVYALGNALH